MINVYYPPVPVGGLNHGVRVFLAGTIDMGKSQDWQADVIKWLKEVLGETKLPVHIFNPRRHDWNSSWLQSIHNKNFRDQVNWELDMLESCDIIALAFMKNSLSPISMLELGLHARGSKELIVYCPNKFWRKGNVDIVCKRNNIPVRIDFEQWKTELAVSIIQKIALKT